MVLTALAPALVGAQATPPAPAFNVLTIYRETVKPGKGVAHDMHEEAWARAVAGAKPPNGFLAISAMSGTPENWYISAYPTWAEYEAANKATAASASLTAIGKQYSAKEDEYLSDARGMVFTFRADLSYGQADLAASRYFSVTRTSVRPGHDAEFVENRRMIKAAHEAARQTDSYTVWQASSGAPAGTYLVFVARKSLAEIDDGAKIHGAAYQAALGGAEAQKKLAANSAAAVISSQTDHFAFAPQQSNAPPEWVAADPAFWKLKAPAPKKAP